MPAGRPKKLPDSVQMALRVPIDLKSKLDAAAVRDGKSLNQTCVDALARVDEAAPTAEALTGYIGDFFGQIGDELYTDGDMAGFLVNRMTDLEPK